MKINAFLIFLLQAKLPLHKAGICPLFCNNKNFADEIYT